MEILNILDDFFKTYKRAIDFYQLMSLLEIKAEEKEILERGLYQLQIQGKVYQDEYGNYMHVSEEFYLKSGYVLLSNKCNFYIRLDGKNIHLKKGQQLKIQKGDFVFVELVSSAKNHVKFQEAEVRSVVKKPISMDFPSYLVKGVVHQKDYQTFVLILDDKVIEIEKKNLGTAYHGDVVTAEIYKDSNKIFARVKQVLERASDVYIYEYRKYQGNLCWVPIGTNYYSVVLLGKQDYQEYDKILARVKSEQNGIAFIECLKKLERENDNFNIAKEIVKCNGFPLEFSEQAIKEAESLEIGSVDEKRINYVNLKTVTIDGANAKDFDDAVSIEKLANGNYLLYVHIADVTNYVKPGMALYQEAYNRGTSRYLENFVFPMFPERLSNDLCSLNPNELKLTVTCKMEIDSSGNVVDFLISDSVIKSAKRMTYNKVDDILEKGIIIDDYKNFIDDLFLMRDLSFILKRKKLTRGYTYFDNDDIRFELDSTGCPQRIVKNNFSTSREIIENFMLVANETVATYLYHLDVPTLYRNHDAPKYYCIEKVIATLKKNGYLNGKINDKDPFLVAKLLKRYRNKKEFASLSSIILNSMSKAYYAPECRGHFGLALFHYLHFTSPIRRFPDVKVHEALKGVWSGKIFSDDSVETLKRDGNYLSEREVAAKEVEKEYHRYLLNLYVSDYIGKEIEAEIIFMDSDNLYLRTLGYVEGTLTHNGNYDKYHKQVLFNGIKYQIGDRVSVVLKGFSKNLGQCIFDIDGYKEKKLLKRQ